MQFKLSAVVLANLLATLAVAVPRNEIPAPEDGLVLTDTFETVNGTLSYYAAGPDFVATKRAVQLEPRQSCGQNLVTCSNNNQGDINVCDRLLNQLQDSKDNIGSSTRAVCFTDGATCCTSWGSDVTALLKGDLWEGAAAVFKSCNGITTPEGFVSGVARFVRLSERCVVQCLSDRATGCPSN